MSAGNSEGTADNQSLYYDAVPISPRQSMDQNTQDESGGQQPVTDQQQPATRIPQQMIPEPPPDFQFNVFLNKLSDSLSEEDISTMKFLFEGEGGIGKGVLEKIKTPKDLFRILRTRDYISRNNLIYLQGILFQAQRNDLITMAVDYATTIGNILHFYAPSYLPENGYTHVKFHVDMHDFQTYTRHDVNLLRSRMATLLFVPEQFVIISGIEPTSSLVVTLMIPDMYVSILKKLLEDGKQTMDIGDLGIDIIEIDGDKIYNIQGATTVEEAETEQKAKLVNVYDQLQQTRKYLDDSEVERLDLGQEIDSLQLKLNDAVANLAIAENQLNTIRKVVSVSSDESKPATLKEISALKEFTASLQQVNMDTNKNVVQRMLNATVNIVSTRFNERHRIQEQRLLLDLKDMESRIEPMLFELERYRVFTAISTIDKTVLEATQKLLQPFIVQPQQVLTDVGHLMLKKISSKLRYKEKEKLKQNYEWSAEGTLEKSMEEEPILFLAGLFHKEIEKTRRHVQLDSFIAKCLTEVGREDLMKFLELKSDRTHASPRFMESKQTKEPRQGKQQQQQPEGMPQQQQRPEHDPIINKMAQQIEEIHRIIQSTRDQYTLNWKSPAFPFEQPTYSQPQAC